MSFRKGLRNYNIADQTVMVNDGESVSPISMKFGEENQFSYGLSLKLHIKGWHYLIL